MVDVKDYPLMLNGEDLNIISNALLELPYRVSAPLIAKIGAQLTALNNPTPTESVATPKRSAKQAKP